MSRLRHFYSPILGAVALIAAAFSSGESFAKEPAPALVERDWENYKEPGLQKPVVDPISVGVGGVMGAVKGAVTVAAGTTALEIAISSARGSIIGVAKSMVWAILKGAGKNVVARDAQPKGKSAGRVVVRPGIDDPRPRGTHPGLPFDGPGAGRPFPWTEHLPRGGGGGGCGGGIGPAEPTWRFCNAV